MYLGPEMSDTKAPAAHGAVEDEGRASTGSVRRQCALAKAETFMPSLDMTPDRPCDGTTSHICGSSSSSPRRTRPRMQDGKFHIHVAEKRNANSSGLCAGLPGAAGGALPVKRHRGEPGHTRDTRDTRDTRAHAGKRITRTNLTTIHPNPKTQIRSRLRRGRPRRTRPCLHPLPERLDPAPARRRSAK